MNKFARLEEHEGYQVLSLVEERTNNEGITGPHLVTRCDLDVSVTIAEGPMEDTEEGWDLAYRMLEDKDLAKFVATSIELVGTNFPSVEQG